MNCFEIQDKLIDLILGELDPESVLLLKEHLMSCPQCSNEFEFLNECFQVCTDDTEGCCEEIFESNYWEEFVVSVHERISHERIGRPFPFNIVVPIAVALVLLGAGYFLFFRPPPSKTVQQDPSIYEYDPYNEIDQLSPEEAEEFIKMINQHFGHE